MLTNVEKSKNKISCNDGLKANPRETTVNTQTHKWRIKRIRMGSPTGLANIDITFPVEGGGEAIIRCPYSYLRRAKQLLDAIADRAPLFPSNVAATDKAQLAFILSLVNADKGVPEIVPDRMGFIDKDQFATYDRIICSDGKSRRIPQASVADEALCDCKGTFAGSRDGVLSLACQSTYLAFACGVALAAPLPSYVRLRADDHDEVGELISESAVFNFSGKSGSGKTSITRAAMSLFGSPVRIGTYDFSERGLAEMAAESNDHLLVLDDTEKAGRAPDSVVRILQGVVHGITGGQSKRISKSVDQSRLPNLRWTTLALSTSPEPLFELTRKNGLRVSRGDQVRLFDIPVQSVEWGGVYNLLKGPKKRRHRMSTLLTGELEKGFLKNHGHVGVEWLKFLMKEDRSADIVRLTKKFVDSVVADGNGWDRRFASKFGIIYAACKLAREAGILPWPAAFPLKAAKKCYRLARRSARSDEELAIACVSKLVAKVNAGEVAVVRREAATVVREGDIGVRFLKAGRVKIGVFDEALLEIAGSPSVKKALTQTLRLKNVIPAGYGAAGTTQERVRVVRSGESFERVRLWVMDLKELEALADTAC